MNIVVRKYNSSDYEIVNKILLDAFGMNKSNCSSDMVHEFVCEYQGNIVGYFYLLDSVDIVEDFKILFLEYLCVDSSYRGLGISNRMMEFILDYAKSSGVKRIELTSNKSRVAAHGLYKKYGFEIRDTSVFRKEII